MLEPDLCLTHTSPVEPTVAHVAVEQTMTTSCSSFELSSEVELWDFHSSSITQLASECVWHKEIVPDSKIMHCGNRDLYAKLQYSPTFAMSPGASAEAKQICKLQCAR
ncbi:hypothetical protein NC653_040488 [Populus alba x Populus x berolinensis]|uniref:Uncharacterized protein n=2 Tax=Populus alba x Populus x berolinensis TaxID=444605 RepID=A0AAD6PMU6_9ROSI|nr:hypothetical protein NC653_040488 [Populus alba x Populus x berolinensis]